MEELISSVNNEKIMELPTFSNFDVFIIPMFHWLSDPIEDNITCCSFLLTDAFIITTIGKLQIFS